MRFDACNASGNAIRAQRWRFGRRFTGGGFAFAFNMRLAGCAAERTLPSPLSG